MCLSKTPQSSCITRHLATTLLTNTTADQYHALKACKQALPRLQVTQGRPAHTLL